MGVASELGPTFDSGSGLAFEHSLSSGRHQPRQALLTSDLQTEEAQLLR